MAIIDYGPMEPKRRSRRLTVFTLVIVTMLAMAVTALLLKPCESDDASTDSVAPSKTAYVTHPPISINGNSGFLGDNSSTGISWGSGTESDPYIIENWNISDQGVQGISIQNSDVHFIISNCYVHDVSYGIILQNCGNGILDSNNCSNNQEGMFILMSSHIRLSNNSCYLNDDIGIWILQSSLTTLSKNSCVSNVHGILLDYSNSNLLSENRCSNQGAGIIVSQSNDNSLIGNNCSGSSVGITITGSDCNRLTNNMCDSNLYGMSLSSSSHNTLTWNQFCDNTNVGICIYSGSSNVIWNNTFVGNNGSNSTCDSNHIQARDDGTANWWNCSEGYGNYWSDWTTPDDDSDGIVDEPYDVVGSAGAKDHCPRTVPVVIPEFGPTFITLFVIAAMMATLVSLRRYREVDE